MTYEAHIFQRNFIFKVLGIVLSILILVHPANSKVEAPNYTFTYEAFTPFLPGASSPDLFAQKGQGETISKEGKSTIRRYLIKHEMYIFPIWVLTSETKVLSMYTRLPSYFLHDVFHQSLINRYGKQDYYKNREEHAIYHWRDTKGLKITYEGACTITCFPIYLSVDFSDKSTVEKPPKTLLQYFAP